MRDDNAAALDSHGFEVPTQLLSKYNAIQQQSSQSGAVAAGAALSWPALLEQAAAKGYRAGGPLPPRFVTAVRDGVPDEHRSTAWLLLSGAAQKRDEHPGLYATLLATGRERSQDVQVEEQIDRDLHRTFPGHPALTEAFCQRIKNVLLAYSARNPEVAYCQGMNFVTAAILMFVHEEDSAFWLLSHVVEDVLIDHYVQSMLGHQVDSQVLEQLLEQQLPHIASHLRSLSLSVPFVTTQWFLCLFLNALPSETCFRVWDLIFCLHPCTIFQVSIALFGSMEEQSLLETTDVGPAVFVIRSAARSCFDASRLFALAQERFHEVTVRRVEAMREKWRQTTMEVLHAKLRVRELQVVQDTVQDTFGHHQARSLLLALRLDGFCAHRAIRHNELTDMLKGYLPEKECGVLLQFILASSPEPGSGSSASAPPPLSPDGGPTSVGASGGGGRVGPDGAGLSRRASSLGALPVNGEKAAQTSSTRDGGTDDGGGSRKGSMRTIRSQELLPSEARREESGPSMLNGAQVAVSVAVLCDGLVEERMRMCFDAFDEGAKGALEPAELIAMLRAIYRTYYRTPPSAEEVAAFTEVVFVLNTPLAKPPSKSELLRYYEEHQKERGGSAAAALEPVPIDRFLHLAAGQPMLVLCFSKRKRLLRTPRIVRPPRQPRPHRESTESNASSDSSFDKFGGSFLPMCVMKRGKSPAPSGQSHSTPPPAKVAPAAPVPPLATQGSLAGGGWGRGAASSSSSSSDLVESFASLTRSTASAMSDVFGGALDGVLAGMEVPLKRNPLGMALLEGKDGKDDQLEALTLAMAEAGLDSAERPRRLRMYIGFDCGESNMKAGKTVFRGKFLHASSEELLGPDPNPYQMAIFMLGKALECIGYVGDVGCFCFNTALHSPRAAAAAAAEPAACGGMEAALHYYNQLPPSLFCGAKGASVASGLAQAVERASAIAEDAKAEGALLTLCVLLTTGQGFDPSLSRAALEAAQARGVGLSLLCLGLGDGPFHELGRLAAAQPLLFNAFDFHSMLHSAKFPDRRLALEAFRVTPEQAHHTREQRRKR